MSTLKDWLSSDDNRRTFAQEQFITSVAEQIWAVMEASGTSKAELAQKTGTSKSHISQILTGSRNMTLRSLADIAHSLGRRPVFMLAPDIGAMSWTARIDSAMFVRINAESVQVADADLHDGRWKTFSLAKTG